MPGNSEGGGPGASVVEAPRATGPKTAEARPVLPPITAAPAREAGQHVSPARAGELATGLASFASGGALNGEGAQAAPPGSEQARDQINADIPGRSPAEQQNLVDAATQRLPGPTGAGTEQPQARLDTSIQAQVARRNSEVARFSQMDAAALQHHADSGNIHAREALAQRHGRHAAGPDSDSTGRHAASTDSGEARTAEQTDQGRHQAVEGATPPGNTTEQAASGAVDNRPEATAPASQSTEAPTPTNGGSETNQPAAAENRVDAPTVPKAAEKTAPLPPEQQRPGQENQAVDPNATEKTTPVPADQAKTGQENQASQPDTKGTKQEAKPDTRTPEQMREDIDKSVKELAEKIDSGEQVPDLSEKLQKLYKENLQANLKENKGGTKTEDMLKKAIKGSKDGKTAGGRDIDRRIGEMQQIRLRMKAIPKEAEELRDQLKQARSDVREAGRKAKSNFDDDNAQQEEANAMNRANTIRDEIIKRKWEGMRLKGRYDVLRAQIRRKLGATNMITGAMESSWAHLKNIARSATATVGESWTDA